MIRVSGLTCAGLLFRLPEMVARKFLQQNQIEVNLKEPALSILNFIQTVFKLKAPLRSCEVVQCASACVATRPAQDKCATGAPVTPLRMSLV